MRFGGMWAAGGGAVPRLVFSRACAVIVTRAEVYIVMAASS